MKRDARWKEIFSEPRGLNEPKSAFANSPRHNCRSAISPESKARFTRSGYPTPMPRKAGHRAAPRQISATSADTQFAGLTREADRFPRALPIGEVGPDGLDLLPGVALSTLGRSDFAVRPEPGMMIVG